MRIHTWSFFGLWAVTAASWLVAVAYAGLALELHLHRFLAFVPFFAFVYAPCLLTARWASVHSEIGVWPLRRIVALWAILPAVALLGIAALPILPFVLVATLVALGILTWAWFDHRQLRGSAPTNHR